MSKSFQYKKQQFQQEAVNSVADVFRNLDFSPLWKIPNFELTSNAKFSQSAEKKTPNFLLANFREALRNNLAAIQERNNIQQDCSLGEDYLVLDTHMETGTGKTFTFINTIFELNKQYNLTHFVVIVPSIAIKEGIKKTFSTTAAYFERLYHRRVEFQELSSARTTKKGRKSAPSGVMNFVYSKHLTALIMTNHSFNSAHNIVNQELEGFYADNARTPMDAIASKNPVLIIDEPQRVEGEKTAERIKNFSPLFVLRYSATFREGQIKNLVYALDSYDAFNKKLVKNIAVTDYKMGATDSAFLGVRRILQQKGHLTAELNVADNAGNSKTVKAGTENQNSPGQLFTETNNPAYKGLLIQEISNRDKNVKFSNGTVLKLGEYTGREKENDNIVTEAMIRDTIDRHLWKEKDLFPRKIKCISLIFIDKVKDYRNYDAEDKLGYLQSLFEKCYQECRKKHIDSGELSDEYRDYLNRWEPKEVHGGYFSVDARNKEIDEGVAEQKNNKARHLQQEISELILRDKERVLDMGNKLRFIFAHSALREGWDNPNVFQICKLRNSFSEINVVQEIGRGLRICVNQELERQDSEELGSEFSSFNRLDVFTLGNGEFINRLQTELSHRRNEKKKDFFMIEVGKIMEVYGIKQRKSVCILGELHKTGCIDEDGYLIKREGMEKTLSEAGLDPQKMLSKLPQTPTLTDGRDEDKGERAVYRVSKTHYGKFKELWKLLHQKVVYQVVYSDDFETKTIDAINKMSGIAPLYLHKKTGTMKTGEGTFQMQESVESSTPLNSNLSVRAFLNQLAEKTNLPRNTVIRILSKIKPEQFATLKNNPFTAVQQIADAVNGVIYQNIVDNIRYIKVKGTRKPESEITLTDREFSALRYLKLSDLPDYKNNNLWQEIAPYDSEDPERKISENALADGSITVFAKLPRALNIPAPMHPKGINPDFAFVVRRENGNNSFYFVAEAKPTTDTDSLTREETRRVDFMKKYFEGIDANIQFKVVSNYSQLLDLFSQAGAIQ